MEATRAECAQTIEQGVARRPLAYEIIRRWPLDPSERVAATSDRLVAEQLCHALNRAIAIAKPIYRYEAQAIEREACHE